MSNRKRRSSPEPDSTTWVCTVCTYRNAREAFKCEICDTRKGTATRKPKLNDKVVEMQEQIQSAIIREVALESKVSPGAFSSNSSVEELRSTTDDMTDDIPVLNKRQRRFTKPPKLKNVDRSTARQFPVTVNGVTVIVTDYKPRSRPNKSLQQQHLVPREPSETNDDSSTVSSPPPPSPCPPTSSIPYKSISSSLQSPKAPLKHSPSDQSGS